MGHARHALLLLCLGGWLCLGGCGDDTGLDVRLVPDPNVTNGDTLVPQLHTMTLLLSSPDGIYPGGARRTEGHLTIDDFDGDGKLDAKWTFDISTLGHLPRLLVERGALPDVPIELRLEGLKVGASGALAAGGVRGIRFVAGQAKRVDVPFNLLPAFRPPQVTQVFPADGSKDLQAKGLSSVLIVFSKRMNELSLADPRTGAFTVSRVIQDREELVAAKEIAVGTLGVGDQAPSTAEYRFAAQLIDGGSFRVRVTPQARDAAGNALDQVPMEPGNQAFLSQFTVGATMVTSPMCAGPNGSCENTWCSHGGAACPTGLECVKGSCQRQQPACPATCPTSTVCDGSLGACVVDCRPNGIGTSAGCGSSKAICGSDGVCRLP